MATQAPAAPEGPQNPAAPSLAIFLGASVDLIALVAEAMRALTREPSDQVVIAAFAGPLTIQVASIRDYLLALAADAPAPVLAQVEALLGRTAAISLTESARLVAANLSLPTTKIAFGDLFEMIKKIILALLDIFGINLGDWVTKLLDLIDEILNFLLSLGSPGLARTLSERQRDAMENLTKLAYLETAIAARRGEVFGA